MGTNNLVSIDTVCMVSLIVDDIPGSIELFSCSIDDGKYYNDSIMCWVGDENCYLKVSDNKIIGYYYCGEYNDISEKNIIINDIPTNNKISCFKRSDEGVHVLGGKLPAFFVLPQTPEFLTPFQYVGTFRCVGTPLHWMGIDDFHIIFPMYECVRSITLEYSNCNEPKLVKVTDHFDSWFEHTGAIGIVETEPKYYKQIDLLPDKPEDHPYDEYIYFGLPVPNFIDKAVYDENDGKQMRYVATFTVDLNVTNGDEALFEVEKRDSNMRMYADYLMVFFNPETRTAYIERIYT